MGGNLEKYKNDLDKLIADGDQLLLALQSEYLPKELEGKRKKGSKEECLDQKKALPLFSIEYQSWYSEALLCVKQLLPDRLKDFTKLYDAISNHLEGPIVIEPSDIETLLSSMRTDIGITDTTTPKFTQQLQIVRSIKKRFESSLFEIRQLEQADLFKSELDAARELNKKGFTRGAGAIAGVVLERYLSQVCKNHGIPIPTRGKYATINDFGQSLKSNDIIEMKDLLSIQLLANLRNLCDHNKEKEPKKEEIDELIDGVDKITKTLF